MHALTEALSFFTDRSYSMGVHTNNQGVHMRKYLKRKLSGLLPAKNLRKQKFMRHMKNRLQHQRQYQLYRYQNRPKSNRFNRWQDYKRLVNRLN